MNPFELLVREHEIIMMVVAAARREAQRLRDSQTVDRKRVEALVDFVRTFADACHHGKEEELLFARMEERGFSREAGPLAVMLFEHDQGRGFIRQVVGNLDQACQGNQLAKLQVALGLEGWADLLQQHIYKENNVLFPMAQQVLTNQDVQELWTAFEKVEHERFAGAHQRYLAVARELAEG